MSQERTETSGSTETGFSPREAYESLSAEFVVLRLALRDCLHQAGIPSNPGWTDHDIVASVANKLGVSNRYHEVSNFVNQQLSHINKDLIEPDPEMK